MIKHTLKKFKLKAKLKHGNRYNYDKVIYVNSNKKVIINCIKHDDFKQSPHKHLLGRGCPECANDKRSISKKKDSSIFLREIKKVHGDKYDYSKVVYKGTAEPITIICKKHGAFTQKARSHLHGHGCVKCSIVQRSKKQTFTNKNFITKARAKHGDKYDYSKTIYKKSSLPVIIICEKHGEFIQYPRNHINGSGCHICSDELSRLRQRSNKEIFISKANLVHANKYIYDNVVYINNKTPVEVICKKHGKFNPRPDNHLNGTGCPMCKESKGERTIRDILIKHRIEYIREYSLPNSKYKYDFYLPKLNILIEYQGIQHYKSISVFGGENGFKKRKHIDILKKDLAALNNTPLIEIKYTVKNVERTLLYKISNYYRYKLDNTFYKNFLELCNKNNLANNTKLNNVKHLLTFNKNHFK